jgi:hypothetical protein
MLFFLGTHEPQWLARTGAPLFVSHVRLRGRRSLPRAKGIWACDSGGFSELSLHGRWTVPAKQYVADVRRYISEIGGLRWAAIQDWMCEEVMLKRTGLKVEDHQRRTVDSYLELKSLAPEVPWCPVLQGWAGFQYKDCVELYLRAGVDLFAEPVVGIGTVCRRQHTFHAEMTIRDLSEAGLKLHGFGFKTQGLLRCDDALVSADSLAWSYAARRELPMQGHDKPGPGRPKGHINCANCIDYAIDWRHQLFNRLAAKRAA